MHLLVDSTQEGQLLDFFKKTLQCLAQFIKKTYLCSRKKENGRLDEWFSHRSAKPGTAVRVR